MTWLLTIPCAIIVFIAILVLRAIGFKPPRPLTGRETGDAVEFDRDAAVARFAKMIRCKTVSYKDERLEEREEFDKFIALLAELYPNVHKTCAVEKMGRSGILFSLKGKSDAAPVVFMSHYDVVPADEASWDNPAFEGVIKDGELWGRGTLDTKATLCGVMEAAETLISQGFVPDNDLYFSFSGDEEVFGPTAPAMVAELKKRGIRPAMTLDEGGAVVSGVFPGVTRPCALVGTAEKGMLVAELTAESRGGHASMPPPHTSVGVLARAVTRIEGRPFKRRLTPPVATMFDTLGRHSTLIYKLVIANLWCFLPVLDKVFRRSGGEMNAMLRTTCAFTMMEGSSASNVLPPLAKVSANIRLIGGDTPGGAVEYMKLAAGDDDVGYGVVYGMDPSPDSPANGAGWDALKDAIALTWPGAIITPYLMFACSDSRHYCDICERVYRFSAMTLTKEQRATIHGHNERIPLESLGKVIEFYIRLMGKC